MIGITPMPCEMCGGEVDELTAGRCNRCKNWKKMCKSLHMGSRGAILAIAGSVIGVEMMFVCFLATIVIFLLTYHYDL